MLLHKKEHHNTHPPSTKSLTSQLNTSGHVSIPIALEGFSRRNLLAGVRTDLSVKESRHSKTKKKIGAMSFQLSSMLPEKGAWKKVEVFKT